jgi:hypothetical protein
MALPACPCSDEMEYRAKTSFKSLEEANDRMPWDPYESEWDEEEEEEEDKEED